MKEKINEESKQILLGSLLGDGAVYQRAKNTSYYSEVHSIKQKDYLLWKNAICFEKFDSKIRTYKGYEKKQGKYYEKIGVYSRSLNNLLIYRKLFYPNGIKKVRQEILDQINGLGLAIWYCDDGSYHLTKKVVRIMTDSFSYSEQRIIQKWFKGKWNLHCKIIKRKRGSFYIKFDAKESEKFLNLIKHHVPDSMLYKLGHLWEGNSKKIEEALKRESIIKQKYYLKNKEKILRRQSTYRKRAEIKRRERLVKQEYYRKNKEKILKRCKIYRRGNKEKIRDQKRIYYNKNIKKIKERQRRCYFENKEKILKRQIAYNKRPEIKERKRIYDRKRYLRKRSV
ncbi:MAG: hypothetical protein GTN38_04680 [Candidatus Aenigmarchaeota archaeon]|nr:hypothetical protein [Candidatus Aenigmarchaeota archaeon]NIP41043.1 hypothetical protein [Candidatus Aenigmarchaeota archaeon]NIQ17445.1 hypothetical protein [Candidatus Aenigmarchaeota archaeon]NIS73639.1 hypothetical protein [Candidatus Aenigmarchaeota archaeon]